MNKLQKIVEVKLTEKEAFLLWSIACWFDKPITSTLKYKLYNDKLSYKQRSELKEKFDKKIMQELSKTGVYIKERHPEWINNSMKGA
jgi:hypothetical protein